MKPISAAALAAMAAQAVVLLHPVPAFADQGCRWTTRTHIVHGVVVTEQVYVCSTETPSGANPAGEGGAADEDPPGVGSAACTAAALAFGFDPADFCAIHDPSSAPVLTNDLIARAFRELPLPGSDLSIQPPGGRTLVNFDTNFFTTGGQPFTRTLRLLGRPVELRIWADSYTWYFGDGESTMTTTPGAKFPDVEVTHNYLQKQTYRPRVDTTYAAEWRVGEGRWRPVAGSATIEGASVGLEAIEARPTLVG